MTKPADGRVGGVEVSSGPVKGRRADRLGELRLHDLSTFVDVCRTGSVTAAARQIGVTPSQVSKTIARLEAALGVRLFTRGARAIALTAHGRNLLPRLEQMVAMSRALARADETPDGELTIAAPSSLLPPILPRVIQALPRTRVRGIELVPALLRGYASEEIFDVALLSDDGGGLPARWHTVRVGELRKALLGTPAMAKKLGARPKPADLKEAPFVGPIVYDGGKFVASTDDCPLDLAERVLASEVGSMGLALRVAEECDQLVFGPVLAAQRELAAGTLVEIQVRGWSTSEPLYLACDAERVLSRVQSAIAVAVRSALEEVVEPTPASVRRGSTMPPPVEA